LKLPPTESSISGRKGRGDRRKTGNAVFVEATSSNNHSLDKLLIAQPQLPVMDNTYPVASSTETEREKTNATVDLPTSNPVTLFWAFRGKPFCSGEPIGFLNKEVN